MKKILYKFLIITFLLIGKLSIAQDCAIVELAKDFSRNSELKTLLQEDNSFKAWRILFSENPSLRSSIPEIKLVAENIEQIEKLGGYKKWIATLSREERKVPKLFFDTQKKFEETVNTSQLPKHLRALVYQYYKKANSENKPHLWKRIEEIFSEYNINRKFPPCNGGYNIRDKVNISEFTKYDRYCNPIGNWDGTSAPILGGSFTSPIVNGKPFDFSSRALNLSENEYKIYFEIEVLEDTGLTRQLADVIPWFNQKGQGKQMMWNLPKDPTTNYPKTWNQLAEEGKIRITIKDVHSSDPNLLKWKGKVIGQTKKNTTFDKLIKENKVSDELKKLGWATDDINLFNNTFKETQTLENAKSWKLLKDAGRTQLMKNADVLEALTKARNNPILKKLGFTDDILVKIKASTLKEGAFKNILDDLDDFATALDKNSIQIQNPTAIISKLLDNNPNNSQAVHWIMQDITQSVKEFAGKKLTFEFSLKNSSQNTAHIDVITDDLPPLLIEYKWLTKGTVSKDDFIREFVKRDLFNISDLSKLQWRIKGGKLTKEKVLEYLSSPEAKNILNSFSEDRKMSLFKNYNKLKGITDKDINEFIKIYYNQIFK